MRLTNGIEHFKLPVDCPTAPLFGKTVGILCGIQRRVGPAGLIDCFRRNRTGRLSRPGLFAKGTAEAQQCRVKDPRHQEPWKATVHCTSPAAIGLGGVKQQPAELRGIGFQPVG
jgi:hypothetical protein